MAEENAKFQAVISAEDETGAAFASVQREFAKLGLTAEQVAKEIGHLKGVDEEDALAQHFKAAEIELRRMGLTADAVTKEMQRLHAVQTAISADASDMRVINPADRWGMLQAGIDQSLLSQLPAHDDGMIHMADYAALQRYNAATAEREGHVDERVAVGLRAAGEGGGEHRSREGSEKREGGEGGEEHRRHLHGYDAIGAHLNLLHTRFGEIRDNIGESGSSLGEMLPMLGAFGAFASIGGLVEMVHDAAEKQTALQQMGKEVGVTGNQLEAYHYAAEQADVSTDEMDRGLQRFGRTVAQANSGQNKIAMAMFQKMGISMEDAHHHLLPMTKLLPEVAQALKNTQDPAMRLYVAETLFGRAGVDLLPLLIQGRDRMEELTEQAEKFGPALTDLDRNHLQEFNDSWRRAEYVSESFMARLSADLAPVMTPLLDDFSRWVAINQKLISQDLTSMVQGTAHAIEAFPWKTAEAAAKGFETVVVGAAKDINDVVQDTTGWKTLLLAIAGIKVARMFGAVIRDLKEIVGLSKGVVEVIGTELPKAWEAALAAEEAYDKNFKGSLAGRLAATALSVYNAASQGTPEHLNAAQQTLVKKWHLAAGVPLTPGEIAQLRAAAPKGSNNAFDQPKVPIIGWFGNLFGDRAALPQVSSPSASGSLPGGRDSRVSVRVHFDNVPPNAQITSEATGNVDYQADVGYNRLGQTPWMVP